MKQLTQRQEEYLLLFADRDGKCKGISEAAELFQVSKPTAFNMSEALEERGLIVKSSFGEIRLTESGWAYISSRLEYLYTLIEWLESDLGLPPLLAEQEARRMVVVLAPETVAAMAQRWKKKRTEVLMSSADELLPELAPGRYIVPFQVCRSGSRELSMGDMGFLKPARLIREADRSLFLLSPKSIRYRPKKRSRMDGILEKMWYRTAESWKEAVIGEDGSRQIPGAAVVFCEDSEGKTGTVHIRARASVGILGMPESEADIVFRFDEIKPDTDIENLD